MQTCLFGQLFIWALWLTGFSLDNILMEEHKCETVRYLCVDSKLGEGGRGGHRQTMLQCFAFCFCVESPLLFVVFNGPMHLSEASLVVAGRSPRTGPASAGSIISSTVKYKLRRTAPESAR